MVLCLEGGYNCASVALSFLACITALLGVPAVHHRDMTQPSREACTDIAKTAEALKPWWPNQNEAFDQAIRIASA